jgi:hypothetical protein
MTDTIVRAHDQETHMPRTATIGPAVLKRVTELTAEGKNRTEAFQTVAQERSMNPGTVAANYYRAARSEGGTKRPKTRARKAPTRRTQAQAPRRRAAQPKTDTDLNTLANQISDLIQQLVRQVEERDQRLRELVG